MEFEEDTETEEKKESKNLRVLRKHPDSEIIRIEQRHNSSMEIFLEIVEMISPGLSDFLSD